MHNNAPFLILKTQEKLFMRSNRCTPARQKELSSRFSQKNMKRDSKIINSVA